MYNKISSDKLMRATLQRLNKIVQESEDEEQIVKAADIIVGFHTSEAYLMQNEEGGIS